MLYVIFRRVYSNLSYQTKRLNLYKLSHKTTLSNRMFPMPICPSSFTCKEKDEETGYGYLPRQARQAHHGARYMDHELMTMWLSVDPMADKYPSISSYAYYIRPHTARCSCGVNVIMLLRGMVGRNAGNQYHKLN